MDLAAMGRFEANMLRCAARRRLNTFDWTVTTVQALVQRGFVELDGPWIDITADGRDALARMEEVA